MWTENCVLSQSHQPPTPKEYEVTQAVAWPPRLSAGRRESGSQRPWLGEAAPQTEGSSVCAQKEPARLGFPGALPQRRVVWMWFGAFPGAFGLGRAPGFSPWVGKIPWRRKWQPTPVLLPGKFHGWRSLAVYGIAKSQTQLRGFTFVLSKG